jgi:hypothetical protein
MFIFLFSFLLTLISILPSQATEKPYKFVENQNNVGIGISGDKNNLSSRATENPYNIFTEQNVEKTHVLFVRFIHYAFTLFICFFIFIFDKKYDIYYFVVFCLLLLHWIFLDECYLSKVENDYFKKNQTGSLTNETPQTKQSISHPYLQIFLKENTDWFILFQGIMMAINISYIIIGRILFRWLLRSPRRQIQKGSSLFYFSTLRSLKNIKYRIFLTIFLLGTMTFLMVKDRVSFF